MKKLVLAIASTFILATTLFAPSAYADEPVADNLVSFNAALTSDYRFRGMSQSRLDPAVSGGVDYTHNPSGFYAGAWASSIKWVKDGGGDGNLELDVYGGKRGEIVKNVTYDFGVLTYVYPGNDLRPNGNTTEAYAQLGYGPAYIKYSSSVTNLFGFEDSKNSTYWNVGTNIDLASGYILNLHAGHQTVKNNASFSYTDWKIGVTRDFGIVTASIAVIGTNNDNYRGPDQQNLGKTGAVATISKTF